MLKLDGRLQAILKGEAEPEDAVERYDLGHLCWRYKKQYAAAARFFAEALADPALPADCQEVSWYPAACSAVLAATGKSKDAVKLDDKERTRLRKQALQWLQTDL